MTRRTTITQRVLSGLVTLASRLLADRTPSAYDPVCDVCNGDLVDGFHWIHRPGAPLMAACLVCTPEAAAAGFTIDPVRRIHVRPA